MNKLKVIIVTLKKWNLINYKNLKKYIKKNIKFILFQIKEIKKKLF